MALIKKGLTTTQIIVGGFAAAIFIGSLLLMLPIAAKTNTATPYIDALFTSTTSICVTGLVTVVTAEHWSFFGQVVIMLLIELGGLGVVTFTTGVLMIFRRRITLKDRLLIQDAYNLNTLKGLVRLTRRIVRGTLVVEGVGALLYMSVFIRDFGFLKGFWMGIFTSVSAFCNAGIDLVGPDSLAPYVSNFTINMTTMLLIIFGGIGFPVWWDIIDAIHSIKAKKNTVKTAVRKLHLHSKIALTMTLILIFGGALLVYLFEYNNPDTMGNYSLGTKILASFFQSVTTRTAGFFTISQGGMRPSTVILSILLMFTGGSPSGTAGGIKTVTLAVVVLAAVSMIKGNNSIEAYHRKIADAYVK